MGYAIRICNQDMQSGYAIRICNQDMQSGYAIRICNINIPLASPNQGIIRSKK